MTAYLFGFAGITGVAVPCEEYDRLWSEANGGPRSTTQGRLKVAAGRTDEAETWRAWYVEGDNLPVLGEHVQTGVGCWHWRYQPLTTAADLGCVGD